jgi:uncharacterized protein
MKKRLSFLCVVGVLVCQFIAITAFGQLKIASGIEGEIYHQFAKDIQNNTDVELVLQTTRGSLENFELIRKGEVDLAFTQLDVLLYGQLRHTGINSYLKLYMPLYAEEIHIVAKNNQQIRNFYDLKDKRVGVGSSLSGTYITSQFLKMKTEIEWTDVLLPPDSALSALFMDSLDAFILVSAAPSNLLKSLSAKQQGLIKLVPVFDKRLEDTYVSHEIKAGVYSWLADDVPTYSVRSLLLINTNVVQGDKIKSADIVLGEIRDNLKNHSTPQTFASEMEGD